MASISANEARGGFLSAFQLELVLRRLAVITAVGALSGLLVGGIGGRLAMMLLARLTPETAGLVSDDGFVIGQLTLSGTLNLALVCLLLGVLGAGVYIVVRALRFGPGWFQIFSISVGAAVVLGAMIVHTGGVDFTVLRPTWLAIALFVAIPGLYAVLLTLMGERWLDPEGRFMHGRRVPALAPLVLWLPLAPLLLAGMLGWLVVAFLRGRESTRAIVTHPAVPWLARLGLTVIFALSVSGLAQDIAELV